MKAASKGDKKKRWEALEEASRLEQELAERHDRERASVSGLHGQLASLVIIGEGVTVGEDERVIGRGGEGVMVGEDERVTGRGGEGVMVGDGEKRKDGKSRAQKRRVSW